MNLDEFKSYVNAERLTQVTATRQANLASIMSVANATINSYHEANLEDMQ